ncbi:MAG: hypothetical protein R3190_03515 [Thermoanaerobaculia bacterium]|nr:hypothetical protein [Thermoanaerobaculia bacterium]
MDTYLHPSPEQIEAIRTLDHDGPITMLNLLRFKPDGGREQYEAYGRAAQPFVAGVGAGVRYLGEVAATVIGGEPWDLVVLVDYPSSDAFFAMATNPDYPAELRTDALLDSRLYCMVGGSPAALGEET